MWCFRPGRPHHCGGAGDASPERVFGSETRTGPGTGDPARARGFRCDRRLATRRAPPAQSTLHDSIHSSTFMDMKEASALYRLLGDEARLRLLRVLARDRLNVTRAHRHPRPGPVRRLAAPRAAEGRRPGRRGARRAASPTTALSSALRAGRRAALAAAGRPSSTRPPAGAAARADDARLQEVLRVRKENFDATPAPTARRPAAGARPQLGRVGARARPPAARRSTSPTSAAAKAT